MGLSKDGSNGRGHAFGEVFLGHNGWTTELESSRNISVDVRNNGPSRSEESATIMFQCLLETEHVEV